MSSCKASHGTAISKASTSSCIYSSFPPAAVRARGTTAPRQQGQKQLSPKASLTVPPQALLGAHPTSNKSSSRGKPDSLTITVISHPYIWLLSMEKRNRFNFPVVYGQIFLLAKRADFFFLFLSLGPFPPCTCVFSAPLSGKNLNGCKEDLEHRVAHVLWCCHHSLFHFPIQSMTLDRQTLHHSVCSAAITS